MFVAGLREVRLLAGCVGVCFGGDPLRVADAAGVIVRRRPLGGRLAMEYHRPTVGAPRGVVFIERTATALERNQLLALALGHHFLRHRQRLTYGWTLTEPLHTETRATNEARAFAAALLTSTHVERPGLRRFG